MDSEPCGVTQAQRRPSRLRDRETPKNSGFRWMAFVDKQEWRFLADRRRRDNAFCRFARDFPGRRTAGAFSCATEEARRVRNRNSQRTAPSRRARPRAGATAGRNEASRELVAGHGGKQPGSNVSERRGSGLQKQETEYDIPERIFECAVGDQAGRLPAYERVERDDHSNNRLPRVLTTQVSRPNFRRNRGRSR